MISHCGFDWHFPDDSCCWAFFFHVFVTICMSSLGKCLFRGSAHLLIGWGSTAPLLLLLLFCYAIVFSCMSSLCILHINCLSHWWLAHAFSHCLSHWWLAHAFSHCLSHWWLAHVFSHCLSLWWLAHAFSHCMLPFFWLLFCRSLLVCRIPLVYFCLVVCAFSEISKKGVAKTNSKIAPYLFCRCFAVLSLIFNS